MRYAVAAESSRWIATPALHGDRRNAGAEVPEGTIHAWAEGRVACGLDEADVARVFLSIDFEKATEFRRCPECERAAVSARIT